VIGERDRVHPELSGTLENLFESKGPIEQAVLTVIVQMDEIRVFHIEGLVISNQ
jgi:hypothetical protein